MVVVGMDDNYVYVNDPYQDASTERQYGEYAVYDRTSFEKAWATETNSAYSALTVQGVFGIIAKQGQITTVRLKVEQNQLVAGIV